MVAKRTNPKSNLISPSFLSFISIIFPKKYKIKIPKKGIQNKIWSLFIFEKFKRSHFIYFGCNKFQVLVISIQNILN